MIKINKVDKIVNALKSKKRIVCNSVEEAKELDRLISVSELRTRINFEKEFKENYYNLITCLVDLDDKCIRFGRTLGMPSWAKECGYVNMDFEDIINRKKVVNKE